MRRNPNSTPGQEQSLTTASTATDGDGNGAFDHELSDCMAALRTELSDDGHHGLGEWVSQAAHDRAEDRHAETDDDSATTTPDASTPATTGASITRPAGWQACHAKRREMDVSS
ncbi:MAG: hypothetical protein JO020_10050 [Chloroflexi bacterium]|nr:hypothetical protein [Chloroflexota bacterium]